MITRQEYVKHLNEGGCPDHDKRILGGRCNSNFYGQWLRKHDPIAFNIGFGEYVAQRLKTGFHHWVRTPQEFNEFVIEKDVPCPKFSSKKYPFPKMCIGDSFVFDKSDFSRVRRGNI